MGYYWWWNDIGVSIGVIVIVICVICLCHYIDTSVIAIMIVGDIAIANVLKTQFVLIGYCWLLYLPLLFIHLIDLVNLILY